MRNRDCNLRNWNDFFFRITWLIRSKPQNGESEKSESVILIGKKLAFLLLHMCVSSILNLFFQTKEFLKNFYGQILILGSKYWIFSKIWMLKQWLALWWAFCRTKYRSSKNIKGSNVLFEKLPAHWISPLPTIPFQISFCQKVSIVVAEFFVFFEGSW